MSKIFKIGDTVILKNERTKAVVTEIISSKKTKILDENDFEYIINTIDIFSFDRNSNSIKSYGTDFYIKDKKDKKIDRINKVNKKSHQLKIDLHIESLITNQDYSKENILDIQLDKCKEAIEIAIKKNKSSLEIIHGVGKKILRTEVHKLLNNYNLRYIVANHGGSTEVFL
tara:strand:+ start:31 stop:543 length:513 start_codon:yes stop_codon:yes gene_type:complete